MKKILNSFAFLFKAFILVLLLLVGWAFINITNLIKGKKSSDKDSLSKNMFDTDEASADAPGPPPPPPPPPSCKATTPFLACFDGKEYKLENDILFGRPNSFYHQYDTAKALYEDGRIFPDLYKITSPVKSYNGKLLFQIQEIEPEESFFKWLELIRVAHPENTEVVVDSDFKKFYVLEKDRLEKKMVLPSSVIDNQGRDRGKEISSQDLLWQYDTASVRSILFNVNENVEITFRNLKRGEIPHLITKTWFRDWVAGELHARIADKKISVLDFFTIAGLKKAATVAVLFISGWAYYKLVLGGESFVFLPLLAGVQCGCGCECLTYGYKDELGEYQWINISDVRSWKHNNEMVELPREAVNSKGELTLRVAATKKHALGFIGLVQEDDLAAASHRNYRTENLNLRQAYHSRLQKDASGALKKGYWKEYLHTIPGDKVDIEFDAPNSELGKNEKETYLLRSSGFYTSLRPEYKKLAGNWQEKISEEAKSRLTFLKSLENYK